MLSARRGVPLAGSAAEQVAVFEEIGALTG